MTLGMAISMSTDSQRFDVDESRYLGLPADGGVVCAADPFDDFDDDDFDDEFDDDFEEEWDDELPGGDNYESEDADKGDGDGFDDDAEFEDE
jgi:hypothetical protein